MSLSPSRRGAPSLVLGLFALAGALSGCGSGSSPPGPACSLPSAASLSVVEVSPANGANGVFVGTDVSIRFNTCLDPATISSTNVILVAGTSFVAAALRYDAVTATVVIDPEASLAYSRLHLVSAANLRGAHGETMAGPFGASFTTQATPETVPPATAASPAGGRYNTPQSVTLTCTDNPGGTGCAATRYTVDGNAPTPASSPYAGPISITSDTVLRFFSVDAQGNAETPRQETYVIDTVPPTLAGSDPADGAHDVVLTKTLTATFDEEMDGATLTAATVSADNGLTFTLAWSAATLTLTLAPTERLVCGTTYQVSVGPGATDVAGNALVQPASFGFTTQADCDEPVTTASLAGGVFTGPQSATLSCTDAGGSGCARIAYTTDGSVPSLVPPNGTVVTGSAAGPIAIGAGDTVLRYFAEDAAGNREALREQRYSVSATGFTFVAMNGGIARGVGPVPSRFEPILPGGRTAVFARDPSNGRLYRGTERGLLASDGGEAFAFLPGDPAQVFSVLPQGSKILAGMSAGLRVSLDGGATWQTRDVGGGWVRSIVAEGQNVWAATEAGVAVSSDRGRTFTLRTTAHGLGSNSVRALVLDGGKLYAATGGGVSVSEDGGASFTTSTIGLASVAVNALVVSGSTVYAGTNSGLSISYDGGVTFTVDRTTANGLGSNHVGALAFDGARLYACTGEPWLSGAGNSFSISSDATGATFTPHALAPSHPTLRAESVHVEGTTVRVGAYPNYYLSTDGGVTFASMDLRPAVRKITGTGSTLFAALSNGSGYGGVAVSTDRGRSFVVRGKDDGIPNANVDDVAASGANVYAATFSGLGDSANGGASFVARTVSTSASNVDCVWASGTTVWACGGSTLNVSTNSGDSFAQRLTGASSPNAVAVHGTNVYLSTSDGLWASSSGAAGTFVRRGTAEGLGSTLLYDVAVDAAGTVLASTNAGLSVSTDAGATFGPVTIPGYPRGLFAEGTTWYVALYTAGVAISQDGGATWTVRGSSDGVTDAANDVWYMAP
jgi:hypothetical protein